MVVHTVSVSLILTNVRAYNTVNFFTGDPPMCYFCAPFVLHDEHSFRSSEPV